MIKTSKATIIIAVFIILAIFAYLLQLIFKTPSNQQAANPNPTPIQVPEISLIDTSKVVWDAKTTVPKARITFSYPREGFYKQSVKLINNQWASDLFSFKEIESLYLTSLPEGFGSQQTSVRVFELDGETTLENILKKLNEEGGMPLQGRYQNINGTRYFLQSSKLTNSPPEVYAYTAYAIINGKLLAVDIQGGFDGSDSKITPSLVTQFLSRLDFTCTSDCSANSAPITDAYRGEQ